MDYKVNLHSLAEKAMFDLRALYKKSGYTHFCLSKFEHYDFYAQNKSFITGTSLLTFTDTNGALLALKPDITLSIVKSTKSQNGAFQKVYYNESVYRAGDGAPFREIMQTGLECIGPLDTLSICEVISLAAESLAKINEAYILDISHIGLLSGFIKTITEHEPSRKALLRHAEEKNTHDAVSICKQLGAAPEQIEALKTLFLLRGTLKETLPVLAKMNLGKSAAPALEELSQISSLLDETDLSEKIYLDLSLMGDESYYNGIIFRGFIKDIALHVLSGGRYDALLRKMNKEGGAIGFAVYLDRLTQPQPNPPCDVDILLLTKETDDPKQVAALIKTLTSSGQTVRVDRAKPEDLKYKKLLHTQEALK